MPKRSTKYFLLLGGTRYGPYKSRDTRRAARGRIERAAYGQGNRDADMMDLMLYDVDVTNNLPKVKLP